MLFSIYLLNNKVVVAIQILTLLEWYYSIAQRVTMTNTQIGLAPFAKSRDALGWRHTQVYVVWQV